LHPATAAFAAVVVAIKYAHKALEDYNKYLDLLNSVNLKPMIDEWKKNKKAVDDAEISASLFSDKLQTIADKQSTITEKTNQAIDAIRRQANAQKEISSAEEARDLARIDLAEKTGKLTELQAIEARLAIQQKGLQDRAALENKADADELAKREQQGIDLIAQKKKEGEAVAALDAQFKKEEAQRALITGRIEQKTEEGKDLIEAQRKLVESLRKGLPEVEPKTPFGMMMQGLKPQEEQVNVYQENLKAQEAILTSMEKLRHENELLLKPATAALALTKQRFEESKALETKTVEEQKTLEKQLETERQITAEKIKQRNLKLGLEVETVGLKAGIAGAKEEKKEESKLEKELREAEAGRKKLEELRAWQAKPQGKTLTAHDEEMMRFLQDVLKHNKNVLDAIKNQNEAIKALKSLSDKPVSPDLKPLEHAVKPDATVKVLNDIVGVVVNGQRRQATAFQEAYNRVLREQEQIKLQLQVNKAGAN